jgi:hypothetical protein
LLPTCDSNWYAVVVAAAQSPKPVAARNKVKTTTSELRMVPMAHLQSVDEMEDVTVLNDGV